MITSAAKWYALSHIVRHLFLWAALLLYAKFLDPDQYGMLIILNVFNGIILLLKDFGLGAALIQSDQDDDYFYSSLYWFNLSISFCCFAALFFLSGMIGSIFENESLSDLIEVISVTFLMLGISGLKVSSFEKRYRFKTIAVFELISVIIASVAGIYFAFVGYQVWAYVIQVITYSSVLMIILSISTDRRLYFHISMSGIKKARAFSKNLIGYSLLNYAMKNLDSIIIGGILGEVALGLYSLAFRVVVYPIQTVSIIAQRVLFPIFSRINDDKKFNSLYIKFTVFLVISLFPMYAIIYIAVPVLVPMIFGDKWAESIELMNLLLPVGLMQIFIAPVGIVYQAKGRTDLLFRWGIISSISTLCVMMISVGWGVVGVAAGFVLITGLLFLPALMIPFSLMRFRVFDLFSEVKRPLFVVISTLAVTIIIKQYFINSDTLEALGLVSAIFLLGYISLMWLVEKNTVITFLTIMGVLKR